MQASAFIAVIGRPSAGKSTLVNTLIGHKVSIVSPVPQTTRNSVRAILSEDRGQLVFIDTPGFHESEKKFNKRLTDLVLSAVNDCDGVLYVVDSSRHFGSEEKAILGILKDCQVPIIIALNKSDLIPHGKKEAQAREEVVTELKAALPQAQIIPISALEGTACQDLKAKLFSMAPQGKAWYPPEYYTDQEPGFRIAEVIREQLMNLTKEEIPHAAYVEIAELELKTPGKPRGEGQEEETVAQAPQEWPSLAADEDDSLDQGEAESEPAPLSGPQEVSEELLPDTMSLWDLDPAQRPKLFIHGVIHVERESQKGIVIGKGGQLIRTMRLESEKQLRDLFPYRIHLDLRVKVSPKWRNDENIIQKLIH